MSTAPMCPPTVWQVSDAELLAELGALEARLHSTWAQMLSVSPKSILGAWPVSWGTGRR